MKAWLKALWSETFSALWAIISGVSTISTFWGPSWSGKFRPLLAISSIAAFGWANYRVFKKKQGEILDLQTSIALHVARVSNLTIVEEPRSRYYLDNTSNSAILEFNLMIENKGQRNSVITSYQVEIVELTLIRNDLKPNESGQFVRGRHSIFGIDSSHCLSKTGNVQVRPEDATGRGNLLFVIPGVSLKQFTDAGLQPNGEGGRFGPLHCRLTIIDTTKNSASHEFTLTEA